MNPARYKAYGIEVGDLNGDGSEEIVVGTGEKGESKPRLIIYDGSSHSEEYSKDVDSNSVWGIESGDFDSDGEPELIYGTSGGELFIYDGIEPGTFEAKTSALSGKTGHYGGIAIGNADNDGALELVVGSDAYLWMFTTEGQTNKPDLAIEGDSISYLPESPDEDEDITINLSVVNYGGADTTKWRVKVYDGDPDAGGKKITEFSCDATEDNQREGCKALSNGESASFEVIWYGIQTDPGYHEIYGLAEDTNQPRQETRFSNNKDFTTIEIEEIPNDKPVVDASIDKTILWVDESARIDAGNSYDNETTNGELDRADSSPDLTYKYYCDNCPFGWIGDYTVDISFDTPGEKEITVVTRDERRKESDPVTIMIEVKANTQPVAILKSNITEVPDEAYVTFDVSESYDPDGRAQLEYRFSFGDNVYSDWVKEGQTVRLYRNAFFTGPNGGELQLDSGEEILTDNFGINRIFRLMNGSNAAISNLNLGEGLFLLEVDSGQITSNGYNYSLPLLFDEKVYSAQLMVREVDESGADDDVLASGWSQMLGITVYLPDNILPVVSAKAGVFINGVGVFNDIVDFAKAGDEITYSGAESYDPDGDDSKLEYSWEIVNSQGFPINLLGDRNERTFVKTYNEPGTYTAILTVTDERGGKNTWQVDVTVSKSGGYGDNNDEEGGYSTTMLIGIAGAGIGVLAALGFGLRRMSGGEDDWGESWEDTATPGPLELNCPTCNGLISITTTQRPIQVGCPMCQSQFVIRE